MAARPARRTLAATPAAGLALLVALLAPAACGGAAGTPEHPVRPLPPYAGHAVELFDDAIEPTAIRGFQLSVPDDPNANLPRSDNLLRERTQVGDAVVRARVTTVTAKDEDRGRTWHLGLHTLQRLAGTGPLDSDFTLEVGMTGASSGIVRAFENRLIGQTFIAFVREFSRPANETELHFHLAPDAKDESDAVSAAALLDRVR